MRRSNTSRPSSAGWRRCCASTAAALLLAGCAAQTAFREGETLLAENQVDAGLAKLQEAIALDPGSAEYRVVYARALEKSVQASLTQGERALGENRLPDAEKAYRRALTLHPANDRALTGLRLVDEARRHQTLYAEAESAWAKKDAEGALGRLRGILAANPKHDRALALQRTIDEQTRKLTRETSLAASYRKPITIEFRDTPLRTVFEVISRTAGLNFVFDKDVRADQKTTIYLRNSTIEAAINVVLLTNQLEQRVLDGNSILIYPNTAAKQKEYQALVVRTYYLANSEAKSVATSLKTILKTKDIAVDEKLNMLIVRDSAEAIRLADKIVALQDVPEPEVLLEVEILEVKRTRLLDLGIRWPEELVLSPLPAVKDGQVTWQSLRELNSSTIGVGNTSVIIRAKQLDTDVNLLANPRIRARNREKAKILIGDRVPSITSNATSTGLISESISYLEVGLKLDIEPTIYLDNEVAIKVTLEVSNIVKEVVTKNSLAYQIGTRTATSVLRLKDGENQLLAGLINEQDRRSANKIPFLGDIPILGRLFGNQAKDGEKTEIVLSITPRIIRNLQRVDARLAEFDGGTETSFRARPEGTGASAAAASGPARPLLPGVPGAPAAAGGRPLPPAVAPPAAGGFPFAAAVPAVAPSPLAAEPVATGSDAAGAQSASPPAAAPMLFQPPTASELPDAAAGSALPGSSDSQSQLLWQGPATVKVGETASVQLVMDAKQAVVSLPMAIGFDPRLLQVVEVSEGGLLRRGGGQTAFTYRVDPGGQVLLTATRSGNGGAASVDTVATISFRAVSAGAARVELITIAPVGIGGATVTTGPLAPHVLTIAP